MVRRGFFCCFFLKESLRLYPPATPTFREVAKDNYGICGYQIPKGTTVAVSAFDIYAFSLLFFKYDLFQFFFKYVEVLFVCF